MLVRIVEPRNLRGNRMRCKDCRYWDQIQGNEFKGKCYNEHFQYEYNITEENKDCLIYWDFECYNAGFETGSDFGCIYFEEK